jgi:Protein of unknown function (DUF2637)
MSRSVLPAHPGKRLSSQMTNRPAVSPDVWLGSVASARPRVAEPCGYRHATPVPWRGAPQPTHAPAGNQTRAERLADTDTLDRSDRTDRLLAAIRVALVAALTALVLVIAALAYVVSFEAIRAFAVETAAFPAELAWSAPLLVDSFTTAASLVILWRYLRGEGWHAP